MTATELKKPIVCKMQIEGTLPFTCVRGLSKLIQLTVVEVSSENEIKPRSGFGLCLTRKNYKESNDQSKELESFSGILFRYMSAVKVDIEAAEEKNRRIHRRKERGKDTDEHGIDIDKQIRPSDCLKYWLSGRQTGRQTDRPSD